MKWHGGAIADKLEPLISLFEGNQEVATNARLFVIYCNVNFEGIQSARQLAIPAPLVTVPLGGIRTIDIIDIHEEEATNRTMGS